MRSGTPVGATSRSHADVATSALTWRVGSVDENGCLVCPWHRPAYDVGTGRMARDRSGSLLRCPAWISVTACSRGCCHSGAPVTERDGELYIDG